MALELLYDYLDGWIAQPTVDPLRDGFCMFRPFTEAVGAPFDGAREGSSGLVELNDGGYARELAATVSRGLTLLPALASTRSAMHRAARRTAAGQIRSHAVRLHGLGQLAQWAASEGAGSGLRWPEFAAGAAASVLSLHALIAAAADERTAAAEAGAIDAAYLQISAVSTMLDSINDYERDARTGRPRAIDWYLGEPPGGALASLARRALQDAALLPNGGRHVMITAGVVSYYTSPAAARDERARAIAAPMRDGLGTFLTPTLAIMRAWRIAKRLRAWRPLRARVALPGQSDAHPPRRAEPSGGHA